MAGKTKVYVTDVRTDDSVSLKLYGKTPRREPELTIRVKPGASHQSWKGGKRSKMNSTDVMDILVYGRHGQRSRPAFDDYINVRGERVKRIIKAELEKGHDVIADKMVRAGNHIKQDLISWVLAGGLNAYPNTGRYANDKYRRFGGMPPGAATGALWQDLEAVFE